MIEENYLQKIAQQILLEMLTDGTVPSPPVLSEATKRATEGVDLSHAISLQRQEPIGFNEASSASKMNRILRRLWDDLDVLYDTSLSNEKVITEASVRTEAELRRMEREISVLIERANRLLLLTDKTEGLLGTLGDNFETADKIDLSATTAFVDIPNQTVHGGYHSSSQEVLGGDIPLDRVLNGNITVTPLDPALRRRPGNLNSQPVDMLVDNERPWIYVLDSVEPLPSAAIDVTINLTRALEGAPINKITFDPYLRNNSILITMQYSMDGVSWKDLPVSDPMRRLAGPTTYIFEDIEPSYLKIIIVKDMYDERVGSFVYKFGVRHLGLHQTKSVFQEASVFRSAALMPVDENDQPIKFTQISLSKVCEHLEPGTNIDYSIAFLVPTEDGPETTDFYQISPLTREARSSTQTLSVAGSTREDVSLTVEADPASFPFDRDNTNKLLQEIELTEKFEVWRNIGFNERLYAVADGTGAAVEAGWRREGPHYLTYGLVDQLGGQTIDFGPKTIEIDGVVCMGKVLLSPGIHLFKVAEENWHSLRGIREVHDIDMSVKRLTGRQASCGVEGLGDLDEPTITNDYTVIDPLYPFNHKLLIEGIVYSRAYQGERKYTGVSRFASHLLREIPESELGANSSEDNYGVFAKTRTADESVVRLMVKVKDGQVPTREQFIITKYSGNYAEGVILNATFTTTNIKRSASLDGYQIRFK